MKEYIVKKEIHIEAKPKVVWDALTNPEKTKKYFFKCEVQSGKEVRSLSKGNSSFSSILN